MNYSSGSGRVGSDERRSTGRPAVMSVALLAIADRAVASIQIDFAQAGRVVAADGSCETGGEELQLWLTD